MARIRTIKPELPQSESLGNVSREARLCFILLWTQADDSGRLRGNSRMLASLLFPYDDDAKDLIEGWLSELEAENCIRRYVVDGSSYIDIPKWLEHQKIDKPSASKLPEFEEGSRPLAKPLESYPADQGRDQGKDQGSKGGADAQSEYAFVGRSIRLKRADYDRWRQSYSGVPDFDAELQAADDYYAASPPKDARAAYFKFSAWLKKAHNDAKADAPSWRDKPLAQMSAKESAEYWKNHPAYRGVE